MARRITKKDREEFELFLMEMDDVLEEFVSEARAVGYELDYSLDSLDVLEEYWFAVSPTAEDPELLMNRMARYYGEVFRLNFGGKWRLSDSDPKDMFYGYPVIYGFSPTAPDYEFCPLFEFHRFTVNKEKGQLREILDLIFPPNLRPKDPTKS